MAESVGIEDLHLYAGPWAIEFARLSDARGHSTKALEAVGFARRSVLPPFEDPVTMAVNAADPLVARYDASTFGLVIVATESSVDYGKPLSTYVHKHLALPEDCRNFEIKHACYAGTAALRMAAAWVRTGEAAGRRALVVMTDSARKHFHDMAELTGGAGAVALVVSTRPDVFQLDDVSGCAAMEIYDVARPTPTAEWGDPVLSLHAYLDLVEIAWESFRKRTGISVPPQDHFDYFLYHTPLISLVEHAHDALLASTDFVEPEVVARSIQAQVLPALDYNREVGNVYAGCVYVALAGLIDSAAPLREDNRIALFSYGSGSCAEFFSGSIGPRASATLAAHGIRAALESRRSIDVAQYEQAVSSLEESLTQPDFTPSLEALPEDYPQENRLILDCVKSYHRQYRRLGEDGG